MSLCWNLEPDMVFLDYKGDIVRLVERVPGDGSRWFVEQYNLITKTWHNTNTELEPCDLKSLYPL